MRKKIAFVLGIVALTSSVCFAGFNLNKNNVTAEDSNNTTIIASSDIDSNIETVSSSLDMVALNLDQISEDSELILKGKALEQSYYTANNHVFTKTKIKVEKVYRGNIKEEKVLNIVEWGGITTEEFNLKMFEEKTGKKATEEEGKKARSKKIKVLSGGIPYSEVGKSSVYFLKKATIQKFGNQIDDNTYAPVGIQGRFDISGNTTNSIATNEINENGINQNDINTFVRPRGTDNELPELKITENDLEKISMR